MGRSPCCAKEGLNRGAWTAMEDKILTDYIKTHGEGKWRILPKKAGLQRCGKSCRLRWLNYLRPDIKRGNITRDEEDLIIRLHKLLGNRWSLIAGRLPGRTDNEIKNYWNTIIGKKLQAHQSPLSSQQPTIHHSPAQPVLSPNVHPCVVRTKASKCTKFLANITSNPQNNGQIDDINPMVALPMAHVPVNETVGNGLVSPEKNSEENGPSDFMMDFQVDEKFLSEFLNTEFSDPTYFDNNPTIDQGQCSSPRSSDQQTLLFCEDELGKSDFHLMASLMDSELDWLHD